MNQSFVEGTQSSIGGPKRNNRVAARYGGLSIQNGVRGGDDLDRVSTSLVPRNIVT
jgi:hypothetical protein